MSQAVLFQILGFVFLGLFVIGLILCIVLAIRLHIFQVFYKVSGLSERAALSKRRKETAARQEEINRRPGAGRTLLINDGVQGAATIKKEVEETETLKIGEAPTVKIYLDDDVEQDTAVLVLDTDLFSEAETSLLPSQLDETTEDLSHAESEGDTTLLGSVGRFELKLNELIVHSDEIIA